MKNRVLMIVGMHRSGTSLLTQWLQRCGLFVGDRLLEASIGNDDGHYEDEEFLALHRHWLSSRDYPDDTGFVLSAPSPLTASERQEAGDLVRKKNGKQEQWGWKEPRTCLWLPLYRDLLPPAYTLLILRSFNDTVNSMVMREYNVFKRKRQQKLAHRKGFSWLKWRYLKAKSPETFFRKHATDFLKVWVLYYDEIIRHVAAVKSEQLLVVPYEDLLRNDRPVFDHLTGQWPFTLHYVPLNSIYKEKLVSRTRDIGPYVTDRSLLEKARLLEEKIRTTGSEGKRASSAA